MDTIFAAHPLANTMPAMTNDEYEALKTDIEANGQHESIKLLDGIILDGRHRYQACRELDLQPTIEEWTGNDPFQYVISVNLNRRHLSNSQRALAAANVAVLPKGANQHTALAASTQKNAAKQFGVSTDSLQRAKKILAFGDQAIIDLVKNDELSIARAAELASLDKKKQVWALKKQDRETLACAAELKAKHGEKVLKERINTIQTRIQNNKPLHSAGGPFSLIYADPPWHYHATGESGSRLRIENHYPTMPTEDICKLPVASICDKDAMLFMWVPSSLLLDGLQVLKAWGFEYVTQAVWFKDTGNAPYMGGIFLQCHETLLVGRMGNGLPAPEAKNKVASVIKAPREEHSKKPESVYKLLEKMYPAFKSNFCELFARKPRKGWSSWGNEV